MLLPSQVTVPKTQLPVHTPLTQVWLTQSGPACVLTPLQMIGALPEHIVGVYGFVQLPAQIPPLHEPGLHDVVSVHCEPSVAQVCTSALFCGLHRCPLGAQVPHTPLPLHTPLPPPHAMPGSTGVWAGVSPAAPPHDAV